MTGADVAAASGSRLVAYTSDGPQPKFALVTSLARAKPVLARR